MWNTTEGVTAGGNREGDAPLIPDFQEAIPGPGCYGEAVVGYSEAGDAVVMSGKNSDSLSLEGVPHVAVEVVVACQEEPPALGEGHRCDTTHYHVVGVHHQLLIIRGREDKVACIQA